MNGRLNPGKSFLSLLCFAAAHCAICAAPHAMKI